MIVVQRSNEKMHKKLLEDMKSKGYSEEETNEATKSFSIPKIIELQRQLKYLQNQINSKNNEITQLKQEKKDLEAELEHKTSENVSLIHQLNQIRGNQISDVLINRDHL